MNKDRLSILDLPKVIYVEIKKFFISEMTSYERTSQSYMLETCFDELNYEENHRSWRLFLSTNNSNYWRTIIRKELYDFTLNRYYSLSYFAKREFRENVLSRMSSSYHQLSLNFFHSSIAGLEESDGDILSNCHYLDLSCNDLTRFPSNFHNIHEINLSRNMMLTDVSSLKTGEGCSINVINLSDCSDLKNVDNLRFVQQLAIMECDQLNSRISLFSNLHTFCFVMTKNNIPELSSLINVKHLGLAYEKTFSSNTWFDDELIDPPEVEEGEEEILSGIFGRVRALKLQFLPLPQLESLTLVGIAIHDVSNLTNLRVLKTSACGMIHGINFLPSLEHLTYDHIEELGFTLVDLSSLHRLKHVTMNTVLSEKYNFVNFPSIKIMKSAKSPIKDARGLSVLREVSLRNCQLLTDVSELGNVRTLDLGRCVSLQSLVGLGKEKQVSVYLDFCPNIVDVSMFTNLQKLKLDYCKKVKDISALSNVPYLSLKGCIAVEDFSGLGKHQKYLDLTACINLCNEHLENFSKVPELIISYCHYVSSVVMLDQVVRLTARRCKGLITLLLKGNYIKADFTGCPNVCVVNVYGNVHTLSVVDISPDAVLNILGTVNVMGDCFQCMYERTGHFEREELDEIDDEEGSDENSAGSYNVEILDEIESLEGSGSVNESEDNWETEDDEVSDHE
jgi:hypothetical protein